MRRIAAYIRYRVELLNTALLFVVVLVVFLMAGSLNELVRGVNYLSLISCGLLGMLLAWGWFSKSGNPWIGLAVLIVLGVIFSALFSENVSTAVFAWISNLSQVIIELLSNQGHGDFVQLQQASIRVSFALQILFDELYRWWGDLLAGGAVYHKQVAIFLWNYVMWLIAGWLGWVVRLEWKPFGVIMPVLGLMTLIVAYIKAKTWILGIVMVVCFALVAFTQHYLRERRWERKSIGYSEEIRMDILAVTLVISIFLIILTLIVPSISVRELVDTVSDVFGRDKELQIAPAVGLYELDEGPYGGDDGNVGVLPVSKLIGNPPDLGDKIVMRVKVSELFATEVADHPYWRSHTYEEYTGSGWLVGDVRLENMQPGEEIHWEFSENRQTYQIEFSVYDNVDKRLYYAGEIITTNKEFGAIYRVAYDEEPAADFFAGFMELQSYQAEIVWPSYASEDLMSASAEYPDWIRERYLQLPSSLPQRVYDLAEQISKDVDVPYQQAVAIEGYLRNYPYTLSITPPPEGQDIVDYFLFDAQKGYCDYFASAMVVLARTVGLPARLVVGYVSGAYDQGVYEVTQAEAHSWAEIYFPELGWVEFEPTSSRLLIRQVKGAEEETHSKMPFSFPSGSSFLWQRLGYWLLHTLFGISLLFGTALGIDVIWLQHGSSERMAKIMYRRLVWLSKKLSVQYRSSLTPNEFATIFQTHLSELWVGSRIAGRFILGSEQKIAFLTQQCVLAVYGIRSLDRGAKKEMASAWGKLLPWMIASKIKIWLHKVVYHEPVPE
ncbi:transglutaminase family protein [Chloroflexota bacterium]